MLPRYRTSSPSSVKYLVDPYNDPAITELFEQIRYSSADPSKQTEYTLNFVQARY
jgi:hypothetical protein